MPQPRAGETPRSPDHQEDGSCIRVWLRESVPDRYQQFATHYDHDWKFPALRRGSGR